MIEFKRTNSKNKDFITLVKSLDTELAERDGKDHVFYAQYNTIDNINCVLLVYENNKPIGCGAIKEFNSETMEIKRMYVLEEFRGKGTAATILKKLENWARELSFNNCILETGKKQFEAVNLYKKNRYKLIPNYDQYIGVDNSVCFKKELN